MIAKTYSIIPFGFDAIPIEIEGDISNGLPGFNIVGMGNRTISEARERVKSALKASKFKWPDRKLTINLAPADQEKDGAYLDLAIALNILILTKQLRQQDINDSIFVGELSLDGSLRPVPGIINIAEKAKKLGYRKLFVPIKNFEQASLIKNIELYCVTNLTDLFRHLKGQSLLTPPNTGSTPIALQPVVKNTATDTDSYAGNSSANPSFSDIYGQELAKRALTIAIAGHHNILLSGPPGTGKTMLAKSALSLLPPLTESEQIAVTKLHSLAGSPIEIIKERPFRSPHHTSSPIALIGGGPKATPGEISLAHLGVLFLDELPEYSRQTIESLRQPLEDRQISISRAKNRFTYPADFMLIATMNPCPCGYLGDPNHHCTCSETQILNYQKKLSGPFLDRIDLFVTVDRIETTKLLVRPTPNSIKTNTHLKTAVQNAIIAEQKRYSTRIYNSSLSSAQVAKYLTLSTSAKTFLDQAASALDLSARSYFKVIKVARTIADLESAPAITKSHLAEALNYRQKPLENITNY